MKHLFVAAALIVAAPVEAGTLRGRIDGGARVAVWLEPDGARLPPAEPAHARLDEAWLSFFPKVQVLPVGSTLVLQNHDEESHTVHAHLSGRTLFNVATVPHEKERRVTLDRPGVITVTCDIHREMRAYLVVTPSRYTTVADLEGNFLLADVPDGRYKVRVWRAPGTTHDDTDPGEVVRTVEVSDATPPLALELPPAMRVVPVERGPAFQPDEPLHTPSEYHFGPSWPRHGVLAWSVVALLLGAAGALGLLRLARRLAMPRMAAAIAGCVLALLAGASVILGLHGAVALALAFGLFMGTALLAA
jgi:plastocyanin